MYKHKESQDDGDDYIDILAIKPQEYTSHEQQLTMFTQSFEKLSLETNSTIDSMQALGHTIPIEVQAKAFDNSAQGQNTFSRLVQNLYAKSSLQEKDQVFALVFPFFSFYVVDKYNHYILERILECGPIHHQVQILELLVRCQIVLAFDTYGCKVLQKGLEISQKSFPNYLQQFVDLITNDGEMLRKFCTDKVGTQLIQKSLDVLEEGDLCCLVDLLRPLIIPEQRRRERFQGICTNQYGCLVVNKIIDIYPKQIDPQSKSVLDNMIRDIIKIQSYLSRRQYSNFIIQQILLKGQQIHREILLNEQIFDDFVSMAMDKYGSNIAEKSIVYGTNEFRTKIWQEKISITESDFLRLFNDQFGNYVIQRVYDHANQHTKLSMHQIVNIVSQKYKLSNYGLIAMRYIEKNNKSQFLNDLNLIACQNLQYQLQMQGMATHPGFQQVLQGPYQEKCYEKQQRFAPSNKFRGN